MRIGVFGATLLPPAARKPGLFRKACELTLRAEGVRPKGDLNVVFVDRAKMLALNQRFLSHDHDTDVIAFNYDAPEGAPAAAAESPFGDVYVSVYQARRQAAELEHPLLRELLTLVVHGTLHLVGYDDATARQRAAMFRRQDAVLARLQPPRRR